MSEERGAGAVAVLPKRLLQTATGFMAARHLFVASEAGQFVGLADGPTTLDQLPARRRLIERAEDADWNGPVAAAYLASGGPADLRALLPFWDQITIKAGASRCRGPHLRRSCWTI